jgi:hypothetical protein
MREELSMARSRGKLSTGTLDTKTELGSTKFFKKMQQEAETAVRGESDGASLQKAGVSHSKNSSAFKL